jgi:hypothetical protein
MGKENDDGMILTNPTRIDPDANPGLRGKRPVLTA